MGDRTALAHQGRPDYRSRIGMSNLSPRRGKPETIESAISTAKSEQGRGKTMAVWARLGRNGIRRLDHAQWDRLSSERTTEADKDY